LHVLVVGAAGMIGRKLSARLLRDGRVAGREISQLTLADIVEPALPNSSVPVATRAVDLARPGVAEGLIAARPDVIFHLAAVVSGEAEANFDKGYEVNLDGGRNLFEAIRHEGMKSPYRPRVVFCSSLAVFGPPFPERIGDSFVVAPLTSYGTQKAICELLLADYSRRGLFDGIGIRLPTICVRPGKPNAAASGFFSNIIREPLAGEEAVLPVEESVRHWFASPRAAVEFLMRGAEVDLSGLGNRRNLIMPGLSATVADEITALRKIGGEKAVRLIRRVPDATIRRIVDGWAPDYEPRLALSLGFAAESSFEDIVRAHVEDELGGKAA
jgi:nucleoside-diphosphate-sugar epimerase